MKWKPGSLHGPQPQLPVARTENLEISDVQSERIVYDLDRHHIHHLNELATNVWSLCDGKHSAIDIHREVSGTRKLPADADLVRAALSELSDAHLLNVPFLPEDSGWSFSRRRALKQASYAAAGSLIVSISAPTAAAADSLDGFCDSPYRYSEYYEVNSGGCAEDCDCPHGKVCFFADDPGNSMCDHG